MKYIYVLIMFMVLLTPVVNAIIEKDFENYIKADKNDDSGTDITLNLFRNIYISKDYNYTIKLIDFDPDGNVALDINYTGIHKKIILQGRQEFGETSLTILTPRLELFNKSIILTTKKIVPPVSFISANPEIELNIDAIRPKIEFEFNIENNSYLMNKEIPLRIKVKNTGDAELSNTEMFIDTDGMKIINGNSYYQLPIIYGTQQENQKGDTSKSINLSLKFPKYPNKKNYTIHVYVSGRYENQKYYNDDTVTISIKPSLSVQKSTTSDTMLYNTKDVKKIYSSVIDEDIAHWPGDGKIYVNIGVKNYQNYEIKNITLKDTIPSIFNYKNRTFTWNFDLKPFESKEFSYVLKGDRPGNIIFPKAVLNYTDSNLNWDVYSDEASTTVHGACFQILKKPEPPIIIKGEKGNIKLIIRNIGDMPSKIMVIDELPQNSKYLGGNLSYKGILLPKETKTISYSFLYTKLGTLELPKPRVYVNEKEYLGCGEVIPASILIREKPTPFPKRTNQFIYNPNPVKPVPAPPEILEKHSLAEAIIPIVMLILAIAILIMLRRSE